MKVTTREVKFRDPNGRMVSSLVIGNGSLHDEVSDYLENSTAVEDAVASATGEWLTENITQPTTPAVDASLSVSGAAADAKKTGDEISELKRDITKTNNDLSAEEARAKEEEARLEALFTTPTQEAVDNWLNEHPEATTTVQDASLTLEKLKNVVNPDQFTGTDSQKLAAAINSLPNGGTVLLGRKYTLTSNVIITRDSNNGLVIVKPINGESIIDCGGYEFGGVGVSDMKTGGVMFDGIRFIGTGNLIDGYYLIRMFFKNCYFSGFNHLLYSSHTHTTQVGTPNRFFQTVYFIDCVIRAINGYIIDAPVVDSVSTKFYDIRISHSIIEWSYGVIRSGWWMGVYITNNAIEGFTGDAPLFVSGEVVNSCVIRNNYFEKNLNTSIDLTSYAVGNVFNVDISNNYFVEDTKSDGSVIALPVRNPSYGIINIEKNTVIFGASTNAVGIYIDDNTAETLSRVNVTGNRATIHDTNNRIPNTKALSELYASELFKVKNEVDQTAGKSVTLNIPITLVALRGNLARTAISFPFVTANNNFTIEITSLNVNDLGNLASDSSLYQKANCGVIIAVSGTFTQGISYVGSIVMKVTFA